MPTAPKPSSRINRPHSRERRFTQVELNYLKGQKEQFDEGKKIILTRKFQGRTLTKADRLHVDRAMRNTYVKNGIVIVGRKNQHIIPWFESNPAAFNEWKVLVKAGLEPEDSAVRILNEHLGTKYDSLSRFTGFIAVRKKTK